MSNIIARSGDGAITIERVNGRLELRTGDGSIRASDVGGELILDTGDGSVTVEGAHGRIDVDTGDGGVERDGPADERQAAHRRRVDRLSRRAGQRDVGQLGHHDRRRRRDAVSADRASAPSSTPTPAMAPSATTSTSLGEPRGRARREPPDASRPARRRRQADSRAHRRRHDQATAVVSLQARRLSACIGATAVARRILDSRLPKRIPPLPALAAAAAVQAAGGLHARQRQLERHAKRLSQRDHVSLVQRREWRGDLDRACPSPSDSACAIVSKNAGVASGNGLPASGPIDTRDSRRAP